MIILLKKWRRISYCVDDRHRVTLSYLDYSRLQPAELASANEKASMLKKKNETKSFFEDMEANIINKVRMSVYVSWSFINMANFTGLLGCHLASFYFEGQVLFLFLFVFTLWRILDSTSQFEVQSVCLPQSAYDAVRVWCTSSCNSIYVKAIRPILLFVWRNSNNRLSYL